MDREFIWKIAGGDPAILETCELKIRRIFTIIGWCVVLISLVCITSAFYSVRMIFDNIAVAIPLAIFFSWVVINIYRLNLITLNKTLLPHKPSKATTVSATILRIMFIALIGYIISKPIGAIIYKDQISVALENENSKTLAAFVQKVRVEFGREEAVLLQELNKLEELPVSETAAGNFVVQRKEFLLARLNKTKDRHQETINKAEYLYQTSNFFIRRIQIMNAEIPGSYLISLLCIALFIVPVIIKKTLEATSTYYVRKSVIEREIITGAYKEFRGIYKAVMVKTTGQEIVFTENYQDAPFNTVRIPDKRKYQKAGTLFDSL